MSLIPAWSHTFVETDHEIFSTVILLLLLIQKGLVSVTSESMCIRYWFTQINKMGLNNPRIGAICTPPDLYFSIKLKNTIESVGAFRRVAEFHIRLTF